MGSRKLKPTIANIVLAGTGHAYDLESKIKRTCNGRGSMRTKSPLMRLPALWCRRAELNAYVHDNTWGFLPNKHPRLENIGFRRKNSSAPGRRNAKQITGSMGGK